MTHQAIVGSSLRYVCRTGDLVPGSGVAALLAGKQIALFYLPNLETTVFALSNFDPIGQAHVLSRGIVGDIEGELVVASPLYKHHFSLISGICLEDPGISVPVHEVHICDDEVYVDVEI